MKKRLVSVLLVAILLVSALVLSACGNPYEIVKGLTKKMLETQKYTVDSQVDMKILVVEGHYETHFAKDGDKTYLRVILNTTAGGLSANYDDEFYFYYDTNGKRQELSKQALDEWNKHDAEIDAEAEKGSNPYLTTEFDWAKFTEDYFDIEGGNTLVLKKEKYEDFFQSSTLAKVVTSFKVSATSSSMSIEYGLNITGQTALVKMGVSDIGKTVVTLPDAQ